MLINKYDHFFFKKKRFIVSRQPIVSWKVVPLLYTLTYTLTYSIAVSYNKKETYIDISQN